MFSWWVGWIVTDLVFGGAVFNYYCVSFLGLSSDCCVRLEFSSDGASVWCWRSLVAPAASLVGFCFDGDEVG